MDVNSVVQTVSDWCKKNWGILLGFAVLILVVAFVR